jgi:transcriptional regulator with XRE-family HTH domain
MPTKRKLILPPINLGSESLGQRLARLRKQRSLTQIQLAQKMGLTQMIISAYECNRIGLNAEMVARFALALDVSADEIVGLQRPASSAEKSSLKITRRLKKILALPPAQQAALFKTIDTFIKAAEKSLD